MYKKWSSKDALAAFQFILQGCLIAGTSVPLYFVFKNPSFSVKNIACLGVILTGVICQAIADSQLQNFKEAKIRGERNESLFREGFWKNARHPNLFFELLLWTGFTTYGKLN